VVGLSNAAAILLSVGPPLESALLVPGDSWLVLNGEFVPGPFDVVVQGGRLLVNGRDVYPRKPPAIVGAPVPVEVRRRSEILDRCRRTFIGLAQDEGLDFARRWAEAFLAAHAEVESARVSDEGAEILVLWRGGSARSSVPVRWRGAAEYYASKRTMKDRAAYLREQLAVPGRLVFLTEELYRQFDSPEGALTLAALERIWRTEPAERDWHRQLRDHDIRLGSREIELLAERFALP